MATVTELRALHHSLAALSDSAALDVDLLLCHCLQRPRSYLYAHPEAQVAPVAEAAFRALLTRRQAGEPVAYLLGRREFWSLELAVDEATLIPRPDTECLVERALHLLSNEAGCRVLDLGTGSGAIALALASERPRWQVFGVDIEPAAVALAGANAQRLGIANARFAVSDWFAALDEQCAFDLIVANPPYIDAGDPHLRRGDVRFEPRGALVAAEHGLAAIRHIVAGAPEWLADGGWLLLEHGHEQGEAARALLRERNLVAVGSGRDYGDRERISWGRRES